MSTEEYKALVRRVVEEGTNGKNLYIFDELVSPRRGESSSSRRKPPPCTPPPRPRTRGREAAHGDDYHRLP